MSGFTKDEVAAEIARREHAEREIEAARAEQVQRNRIGNADAECIHCHLPCNSITGGDHGLCDQCLHAD